MTKGGNGVAGLSLVAVGAMVLVAACASARPQVLRPGLLSPELSYALVFTYEGGERETRIGPDGVERRVVEVSQPVRLLVFRDAIIFELQELGLMVGTDPTTAEVTISLSATGRGVLDIVSLVFSQSESPGEPIARIRFENGGRWRFVGKGNEDMASYVAESIIRLIRPDSLDRQPTDY